MFDNACCTSPDLKWRLMLSKVSVVPLMADKTTKTCPSWCRILPIFFILLALPAEVPPNLNTFMFLNFVIKKARSNIFDRAFDFIYKYHQYSIYRSWISLRFNCLLFLMVNFIFLFSDCKHRNIFLNQNTTGKNVSLCPELDVV